MLRRFCILLAGVVLVPGCVHSRSSSVSKDHLADLADAAHADPVPAHSPYDVRGVAPSGRDEPPTPAPVQQVKADSPPEFRPTFPSMELTSRGQLPEMPLPTLPQSAKPAETLKPTTATVKLDPLTSALQCCRENRPIDRQLQSFDPPTRDLLAVLLPLTARVGDRRPVDAALLDPLERLMAALRSRMPLVVDRLCYCRSIDSFGIYDPLPSDAAFQTGTDTRPGDLVQLYVELKNFSCRPSGSMFETALGCTLTLREGDKLVWRQDRPAEVKRSHSPRHDCHLGCHFFVPPKLPPGDYVLTIQVKDLTGTSGDEAAQARTASKSLKFQVKATARGN